MNGGQFTEVELFTQRCTLETNEPEALTSIRGETTADDDGDDDDSMKGELALLPLELS